MYMYRSNSLNALQVYIIANAVDLYYRYNCGTAGLLRNGMRCIMPAGLTFGESTRPNAKFWFLDSTQIPRNCRSAHDWLTESEPRRWPSERPLSMHGPLRATHSPRVYCIESASKVLQRIEGAVALA